MTRKHWALSALLAGAVGCTQENNPNEANFPGAPGSSVPVPTGATAPGPAAGQSKGDGSNLPSSYPGAAARQSEAAPTGDADKAKPSDAASKGEPSADPAKVKGEADAATKTEATPPKTEEAPAKAEAPKAETPAAK